MAQRTKKRFALKYLLEMILIYETSSLYSSFDRLKIISQALFCSVNESAWQILVVSLSSSLLRVRTKVAIFVSKLMMILQWATHII